MQELAAQGRHKLPVMFWLFGGAYIFGSAGTGTLSDPNLYVGTSVVHQKDVIVVTANARVGVFGFLLTGNLTGNYGIDDHLMAIRWTFRNIGRFGGDPEQITVFGCSSGAFSSGLIAMHPEAPPIQRVIMMSPPSALHLTSRQQAMADGKVFTAAAGCNDGSRSVENCLRQASATRLYLADSMTARNGYSYRIIDRPLKWMPVDGGRYRDISTQLLRERKRKRRQIDWMIGVTAHEMTFFLFGMETFNLLRGSTFYYLRGNQSAVEFWLSWLMGEHWAVEKYQPYRDILSLQRPLSHADRQFIRLVERFFGNGNNREHLMRLLAAYPPRYSTSENINQLQDLLTDYLFICSNQKV
jgi:carboxylesterase type B